MAQHAALTAERWCTFSLDQQILMIANEMNRASKVLASTDKAHLESSYERVLALTDLTIEVQPKRSLRRELLRWRDLVASLFIAPEPQSADHHAALRCLLLLTPEAAKQIPFVVARPRT